VEALLAQVRRAVWDSASGLADISILWGDVREVAPDLPDGEQIELLRTAVLSLLDEGLIYAYLARWDDGPNASEASAEHLSRERVERYLADREDDTTANRFFWVGETSRGAEAWPPD
jgi:hypothetical protein